MLTREEKSRAKRRWARWYPKKDDDKIMERWADACSRINNECHSCELAEHCQDLADRLIVCMIVPSTGGRKRNGKTQSGKQLRFETQRFPQDSEDEEDYGQRDKASLSQTDSQALTCP